MDIGMGGTGGPAVTVRCAQVRRAGGGAHAGAGRARAGARRGARPPPRPRLQPGAAPGLGAAQGRPGAQPVRAARGPRHAGLEHGGAGGPAPARALARPRHLLPEGPKYIPEQDAGVLAGRAAGGRRPARRGARPRRLPAQPLQRQKEPLRLLVRHQARGVGAAHDRQGRHDGLPLVPRTHTVNHTHAHTHTHTHRHTRPEQSGCRTITNEGDERFIDRIVDHQPMEKYIFP